MKNEKGVTLLALVITLTVLAIIGFTVFFTAKELDENVEDDVLIEELKTVQHIVLQEYNKKLTLGDEYIYKGTKVTNIETYNTNLGINLLTSNSYYELTPDNFKSLRVKNVSSKYLVCYETGEVVNIDYKTSGGEILYTK